MGDVYGSFRRLNSRKRIAGTTNTISPNTQPFPLLFSCRISALFVLVGVTVETVIFVSGVEVDVQSTNEVKTTNSAGEAVYDGLEVMVDV
jgi:hypothetical protein